MRLGTRGLRGIGSLEYSIKLLYLTRTSECRELLVSRNR